MTERTPGRSDDPTGAGEAPAGLAGVRGLHRTGAIAEDYPRLRGLLAGLSSDDLATAGRLLGRTPVEQILARHPDTPVVRVAITGNGVRGGLADSLTAECARHGVAAEIAESGFDTWVTDLGDPDGGFAAGRPGLALVVLDPTIALAGVPNPWRPDDIDAALGEQVARLSALARRFATTGATVVLNTIPLPRLLSAQLIDHRSRARLGAVWRAANQRVLDLAVEPGIVVIDLDPLIGEGIAVADPRLSTYAKAHLSPALLARYAREVGHLARHRAGRTSKVLAVDLDGTLWGGVLGDDGPDGIEVADSYRGEAFHAVQRVVRQLASQGVLLAAVSKNDLEPVRDVLRTHPGLAVREDDFVRVVANWRPKPDNLRELAADLNLGVDGVVFVDDSPYERGLVRHELPATAVIDLDDEPAHHLTRVLADGWFDVPELTADDRARPARYRVELERKDFLDGFESIQDYLRELDVRVRVSRATERELARISQITLRTNQFNLSTERLQIGEVRALHTDPGGYVLAVHAADRFGDNGLVGAVLGRRRGTELHLDNFLLSCRVFARGVEQATLAGVLAHARDSGASGVFGRYRRTAKNATVRDFYTRSGFHTVTDDGTTATFRHDLAEIAGPPEHVQLTSEWERTTG